MRKDVKAGLFVGMSIAFVGWVLFALFSDSLQERRQKQLVNEPAIPSPVQPLMPPEKQAPENPPQSNQKTTEPVQPAPVQVIAQIHTVQTGQTLSSISSQYYGNPAQWQKILDANSDILKNDPTKLRPGMRLKIPAK